MKETDPKKHGVACTCCGDHSDLVTRSDRANMYGGKAITGMEHKIIEIGMRNWNRYSIATGIYDKPMKPKDEEYLKRLKIYRQTGRWDLDDYHDSDGNVASSNSNVAVGTVDGGNCDDGSSSSSDEEDTTDKLDTNQPNLKKSAKPTIEENNVTTEESCYNFIEDMNNSK